MIFVKTNLIHQPLKQAVMMMSHTLGHQLVLVLVGLVLRMRHHHDRLFEWLVYEIRFHKYHV